MVTLNNSVSMSKHYHIHLPVKPHIQKYISIKEGNPIQALNKSILWMVLRPYLVYKINDRLSDKSRQQQLSLLKGRVQIQIAKSQVRSYGLHMRGGAVVLVNKFLDNFFGRELYLHVQKCEANQGRYKGYKQAIEEFADKYDIIIEEDISMDALLKMYQRQKEYEENRCKNRPSA
jgi:hypothetical protein